MKDVLRIAKLRVRTACGLLILLVCPLAVAESVIGADACVTRDMSQAFGPARDQGEKEWCFAYAAADFLSFHHHQKISALDVAVQSLTYRSAMPAPGYMRNADEGLKSASDAELSRAELSETNREVNTGQLMSQREGGNESENSAVYAYERAGGLCTEVQLPSEARSKLFKGSENFIAGQLKELEGGSLKSASGKKEDCGPAGSKKVTSLGLLGNALNDESVRQVRERIGKRCEPRSFAKPLDARTGVAFFSQGRVANLKTAVAALSRSSPVLMSFEGCAPTHECGPGAGKPSHAGNAVGMKWDPKQNRCMFLVRNTWGPNWNECVKAGGAKQKNMKDFESEPCQPGHFWMSEKDMLRHVHAVTVVGG